MRKAIFIVACVCWCATMGAGCSLLVTPTTFEDGADAGDAGVAPIDGGIDAALADAGPDAAPGGPCGNGLSNTGEACDDANTSPSDGCSATCTVETGFECDGFGADSCAAICGDGMMLGDEACDDGFETACGDCNADCTAAGTAIACGDGAICTDSEACDDMNTADDDGCAAGCDAIETGWVCAGEPSVCEETCNNGVLDMGETCDDGANVPGDGCSAACQMEAGWSCTGMPSVCAAVCGDGMVIAGEEECDDMDTMSGDGCSMTCDEETGWTCAGAPSVCAAVCGDGMVIAGEEVCDDGDVMTETECPYPMPTCTLCNATCSMELMLTGRFCGDGTRDVADGEACDDGDTMTETECPYAMPTCTLCNATCGMELMLTGRFCGDGTRDAADGEVCDDGDTVTETACPYGTATCTLCNATCAMSLSLTGNVCGDGVEDAMNETCDDRNLNTCGLCSVDCGTERTYQTATGSITVAARDTGTNGNQFTLNDGAGSTVTYEIETGSAGACPALPIVCILIPSGVTTAAGVATTVADAINMETAIGIDASASGSTVTLTNDSRGGAGNGQTGNIPISGTVTGWTFSGMTGGVARDCAGSIGCTSDDDCRSGNCRAAGTCAP